ncbi:hypothetical protein AB3480_06375 [Rhizobium mongolense]|uniref:hypothetical protein n=1 Tax=Rhizobium mongolense TaxID=57676 RepID=UPI0034A0E6D5
MDRRTFIKAAVVAASTPAAAVAPTAMAVSLPAVATVDGSQEDICVRLTRELIVEMSKLPGVPGSGKDTWFDIHRARGQRARYVKHEGRMGEKEDWLFVTFDREGGEA